MRLNERDELEGQFVRRLQSLSQKQQREILTAMGNPPHPDKIPKTLWEKLERERKEEIAAMLLLFYLLMSSQAGSSRDSAILRAELWADSVAEDTASRHTQRTKEEIEEKFEQEAKSKSTNETGDPETGKQASADVSQQEAKAVVNDVLNPARDEGVAVTLTTAAENAAAQAAVEEQDLLSEEDIWYTAEDDRVCQVCGELHNQPRSVWSRKFPMGAPAHPWCRCRVEYKNRHLMGKRGRFF